MKIEGKFYNRMTPECRWTWWRWSFMYAHIVCLCSTHTHLKDRKAEWPNQQTLNTCPLLKKIVQNSTIGQQLSQQSQNQTTSIELQYSNSFQQFSAYTFIQCIHLLVIDFSLAHKLLSPSFIIWQDIWNQTWYLLHLKATSFHYYTIKQYGVCLHWRLQVNVSNQL